MLKFSYKYISADADARVSPSGLKAQESTHPNEREK
jgi:hypothetical protein